MRLVDPNAENKYKVQPGLGAKFKLPIWNTEKFELLENIYGSISKIGHSHPSLFGQRRWLLSRVNGSSLLQTNVKMHTSKKHLAGVFKMACEFPVLPVLTMELL